MSTDSPTKKFNTNHILYHFFGQNFCVVYFRDPLFVISIQTVCLATNWQLFLRKKSTEKKYFAHNFSEKYFLCLFFHLIPKKVFPLLFIAFVVREVYCLLIRDQKICVHFIATIVLLSEKFYYPTTYIRQQQQQQHNNAISL